MRVILCLLLFLTTICSIVSASPEIQINIPAYVLQLLDKGQVIKQYKIAVGTPYEQTPTGVFHIFDKIVDPTWYPGANFTERDPVPPGPDNPLGSRWMEFKIGYGIHGTNKDWDINYPVSGGCIRMHDADARELFELVPIGTPVIVTYETMFLYEKADGLYLKLLPDIYNRQTNTPDRFFDLFTAYSDKYVLPRPDRIVPAKLDYDVVYESKVAVPKTKLHQ